jgi:hypothetical protein
MQIFPFKLLKSVEVGQKVAYPTVNGSYSYQYTSTRYNVGTVQGHTQDGYAIVDGLYYLPSQLLSVAE